MLAWMAGPAAFGQTGILFEDNYPESERCAGLFADYTIASNSITVQFQNAYIRGDFLDTDLKDQSLLKMRDMNKVGSLFNGGLYYRWKADRFMGIDSLSLFTGLFYRSHFSADYPGDLFELYFYGNRPFGGETADISDFHYLQLIYQQLQFGIMKSASCGAGTFRYAASLSLLNGQDYLEIETGEGSLYTQEDIEYVDMNLYLGARQSDTLNQDFGSQSGLGASLSLEAWYGVEDQFTVGVMVRDLGAIAWNGKSSSFSVDTSYHFEGVVVNNLLDSLYLDLKSETEFKEGFKENRVSESFTAAIPATVSVVFTKPFSGLLTAQLGGSYILNGHADPSVFVKGIWSFGYFVRASLQFSMGGYTGVGMGAGLDVDLSRGYIMSVGAPFMNGYITSKTGTAQGAFARLKKVF
jgi:hypothetical protein